MKYPEPVPGLPLKTNTQHLRNGAGCIELLLRGREIMSGLVLDVMLYCFELLLRGREII